MTPSRPPSGRVALVTGASSGIGRVTARDLAARGDTVVMVSRGGGRGAAVAEEVRAETGGDVHYLAADLGRLADQRALVEAFRQRFDRLDALVLNAGAYFAAREETSDGIEATWALNHLGAFTPALLLADLLVASAPARVVITSSDAALMARFRWDDLEYRERYQGWGAYAQSKLANQVVVRELGRRFAGTGVAAHAFHPGFVATGFGGGDGFMARLIGVAQRFFARTPERGADTMTWLATADEALATTGGYWADRTAKPHARGARGDEVGPQLWERSLEQARVTPAERAAFDRVATAAA
ncbi:MAG: SDR family NAD(P)-dependent oxidoreductase [Trueperaceae bacterium]|nr:SDR family NAD(P)-dependent oxidoreductase [Trueperaceae bacterium]